MLLEKQRSAALVRRVVKGDKDAFVSLITHYRQYMYATAMTVTRSEPDALDAIQDTVLTLWEKLDSLRDPEAFKTWMTRILVNFCRARLRERGMAIPLEEWEEAGEPPNWDESMDVRRVLSLLSEEDRLILQLFYFEDMPTKEIAQALDLSPEAVRMRLTRSRKRFKEKYGEEARHEGY